MELEIAIDLVCPWCYLAKARVDKALLMNSAARNLPRWVPYQLTPDLATDGVDHAAFFADRVGKEEAKRIYAMMEKKAAEEGLKLDYSRIAKLPNTGKAHTLVKMVSDREEAGRLVGRLLGAHFAEGLDIGNTATLIELGTSQGLRSEDILRAFSSDTAIAELKEVRATLTKRGVKGVPAFMVDGQIVASGLPTLPELSIMMSGASA